MNNIINRIKEARPRLSQSSLDLYVRNLKKLNNNKVPRSLTYLNNFDKVMNLINTEMKSDAVRKTALTSIVVALKSSKRPKKDLINQYSNNMMKLVEANDIKQRQQVRTPKQEQNWLSLDEIKNIANKLFNDIKEKGIDKKDTLTISGYKLFQEYLLLRLYIEYPVRNDLSLYRIHENQQRDENKNYLIEMNNGDYVIELNKYKTSKTFGQKRYILSKGLKKLLKIFFKHNTSPYLLTNVDRKTMLSRNSLTKTLQQIFMREAGKKIGSSLLRHIQAFERNKDKPTIKEQEDNEKNIQDTFLHNGNMNNVYSVRSNLEN